jgi:TolB-like protein
MRAPLVLALSALLVMTGCGVTEQTEPVPEPDMARPQVDIELASYGAVDHLVETARAPLSPDKPIIVTSMVDNGDLTRSSPLGRLIAEQMATRLASAGYTVREVRFGATLKVRPGTGELVLSRDLRDISRSVGAQAVIAGTYTPASSRVFVTTKMIHGISGDLLSAVDFELPMQGDVKSLLPGHLAAVEASRDLREWDRHSYSAY